MNSKATKGQAESRGTVPDEPPDAGICSATVSAKPGLSRGRLTMPYHLVTGKPFRHRTS